MFCAYTRPRYQMSVYRTIGPLVLKISKQPGPLAGSTWLIKFRQISLRRRDGCLPVRQGLPRITGPGVSNRDNAYLKNLFLRNQKEVKLKLNIQAYNISLYINCVFIVNVHLLSLL